jgi:hypothetical protein
MELLGSTENFWRIKQLFKFKFPAIPTPLFDSKFAILAIKIEHMNKSQSIYRFFELQFMAFQYDNLKNDLSEFRMFPGKFKFKVLLEHLESHKIFNRISK